MRIILILAGIFLMIQLSDVSMGRACTRVLWNDSGRDVYVGRSMDWFEDLQSHIWVLPRGMKRGGLTKENPLQWTSRFGSLAISAYDALTVDGINEAGLTAHFLYLPETTTSLRDPSIPGMAFSLWAQYYLDQFATVQEAVDHTTNKAFQLVLVTEPKHQIPSTLHLALSDKNGDSAILELIEGKFQIYHNRDHRAHQSADL